LEFSGVPPRFAGRVRARSLPTGPPDPRTGHPGSPRPRGSGGAGRRARRWDGGHRRVRVGESKTVTHTVVCVGTLGRHANAGHVPHAPPRAATPVLHICCVVSSSSSCAPPARHLTARHRTSPPGSAGFLCILWPSVFCSYPPPPPQPSTPITPVPSLVSSIHGVALYSTTTLRR
jgi:hypothetical protein